MTPFDHSSGKKPESKIILNISVICPESISQVAIKYSFNTLSAVDLFLLKLLIAPCTSDIEILLPRTSKIASVLLIIV